MEKNIGILLVDDHQVVREGLRHMLGREEDMEVVGEADGATEALNLVELLSPEVILMDIKMPEMDGIELTRQLLEKQPACNVIMLTLYDEYMEQALQVGAGGYLLKDIKRAELTQAIRQVHRGEVVISKSITAKPRIESEERGSEKAKEDLLQEHGGSSTMVEEVQMVIPPPIDANQLMRFVSRAEEMLQSRMLQMVGSWKGGTAITIPLPKPTPLADILNTLGEIPEVETVEEKPLTREAEPRLFKKADAISKPKTRLRKAIFVTLKND